MAQVQYKFKGCQKCGGDLIFDWYDEWHCVQCSKIYYAKEPEPKLASEGRRIREVSTINSQINSKGTWDTAWEARHPDLIKYFDQGLPIHQIAQLTGHSKCILKNFRDRWLEIRTKQLI